MSPLRTAVISHTLLALPLKSLYSTVNNYSVDVIIIARPSIVSINLLSQLVAVNSLVKSISLR